MSIEGRLDKTNAYKEAGRVISEQKDYNNYKQTMSDEEFAEAWNKVCKTVKEGLKC